MLPSGNHHLEGHSGGYQKGHLWGGINYIDHGTGMHVRGRYGEESL